MGCEPHGGPAEMVWTGTIPWLRDETSGTPAEVELTKELRSSGPQLEVDDGKSNGLTEVGLGQLAAEIN